MIWISFKEVLDEVALAIGLDPQSNLQENVAASICRYIQKRVRQEWRANDWPDLCLVEQRAFRPAWDVASEYAAGDEVYDLASDCYYMALVAQVGIPVTNAATWSVARLLNRYVALEQPGQTRIGDPLAATRLNPELERNPGVLAFGRSARGIQFDASAPNRPWIKFRLPTPRFSTARIDRNEPGQLGDVFFDPADGNCYRISNVSAADWPPTVLGGSVELQAIPDFLKDIVVASVVADTLREDGQYDKAAAQKGEARELRDDETDQLNLQQNQTRRYSVRVR